MSLSNNGLLADIIASVAEGIVSVDDQLRIVLFNPAAEQMFGRSREEMIGQPLRALLPERYRAHHDERIRNFASTGQTSRGMGHYGQIYGLRANGEEFPIEATISQAGTPRNNLFTVILRDITPRLETEKALRKNYEILDRIFATTHFCVVYLDRDLNFVRVNKAYADACGHPPEFFPGKNHFDLYPGEKVEAIFRRVVATGEPFTIYANPFEFPDHPERGVTYWDWTLQPLRSTDGAVEGLLFVLLDVTERKRTVHELERKTALAQLLEFLARTANEAAMPEHAMQVCLQQLCDFGKWTLGRVGFYRSGGAPRFPDRSVWQATDLARFDEFIRASENCRSFQVKGQLLGVVLGEERPVWIPDLNEAYGLARRRVALAHDLHAAFAFPVIVQDEVAAFLEFYADEPRPPDPALIAASETIAVQLAHLIERSRAAQVNAQLAAIVQSSNDAIVSRGPDGAILTWNAAAERLFGYTAAEVIGRNISLIIPADQEARRAQRLALLKDGLFVPTYDAVRLGKGGRRIDVALTASAIKDASGKMMGISLVFHDISERKRNEVALRSYAARLRELSRRLREVEESERHAISRELHDRIGQGLSTLSLMVGTLDAKLSQESRSAVETQLQDMQALLRSLVTHARDIMAELRPPVLDDYGLFAALRHLVTEFANRTGIAVEFSGVDLLPRLPLIVETAMFRIIQEALTNIVKHAHAKKVEISLNPAADRVVLDIADDGVGFDTDRILQGGQRWGITTMRERAEGAGITFHLESALGAGTRVVLEVERAAT